jgi:hypothetical protein
VSNISSPTINYKQAAESALKHLRNERDRQIVAQRFGLGLSKRYTLEKIGSSFGITRERVRQIEKAATSRLKTAKIPEVVAADQWLTDHLGVVGHIQPLERVAAKLGATTPADQAYVLFLATLAPNIEVIDDNDHFEPSLSLLPEFDQPRIRQLASALTDHLRTIGKPTTMTDLHRRVDADVAELTLRNVATASKHIANLGENWGLVTWPEVNPKSIRDKTYLVLREAGSPLHFSEISTRINDFGSRKRNVTTQAVHNELIKDPRFVLVGRGIYALADWGYTPGTVADIIADILREQSPLHKDEIIKRVLDKRQVKTTTIVLNLQEKDQFVRVAKATYALKN